MPHAIRQRLPRVGLALAVTVALAGAAAAQQGGGGRPQPVTVVTLEARDVTLTTTLPGRVVASGVAEVRPQVDGIIEERLFEEGASVRLGDPLYRIDPDAYEAEVVAAEAEVAQARAELRAAQRDVTRLEQLLERNVTSQQNYDDALAERDTAEAAVKVAEARRLSAEIELERTTVRAPLSGVVGRSLTTEGALATAGQAQPLAVIRQLDPVLVDVTQSAAELIAWKRGRGIERLGDADLTVSLTLADGEPYAETGQLTAAEPNVNERTGVVTLRMEFPNPEALLLPGMYVQVEMPQGVVRDAVLAPQEGITRDRRGRPVAMVVTPENTVEERRISIVGARRADWIVDEGLGDGDRLIVAGLQKIRPGAKVAPEERASGDPAAGSAGAGSAAGPDAGTGASN